MSAPTAMSTIPPTRVGERDPWDGRDARVAVIQLSSTARLDNGNGLLNFW
jgi:hypothetical protein